MLQFRSLLPIFLLLVVFLGCKNDKAAGPEETKPSTSTAPAAAPDGAEMSTNTPASEIRYTWVDQLNVRDQPNTKGKVVARVSPNEPLTLTGETSGKAETIVLRGVAYHEPWFRISTADKKDGWVFGGAVKKEDEFKGNAQLKNEVLDFPVFGVMDLKDWTALSETNREEGDAETTLRSYRAPNGQVLEIEMTDVGEYGYYENYSLQDDKGNLLKKRSLHFEVDPDLILKEEVVDYTDIPAKRYHRSQKMEQHFMQMNDRPRMATGEWESERLD